MSADPFIFLKGFFLSVIFLSLECGVCFHIFLYCEHEEFFLYVC